MKKGKVVGEAVESRSRAELQAGGRHYPGSGTPPPLSPNPREPLATSQGSDGLGGRG